MPIMWTENKELPIIWRKVELGSKAGALRQMLLDMLEDSQEIRRLCIVGRNCILGNYSNVECSVPLDRQIAEGKCVA